MSKKVIVEWDYLSFENLFYSLNGLNCFALVNSVVQLGSKNKAQVYTICDPPGGWYQTQHTNSGLTIPCMTPILSPAEILIAPGECYQNISGTLGIYWIATFYDLNNVYTQKNIGRAFLPLEPLLERDCIKYILNIAVISLGTILWTMHNPDPYVSCDTGCECCCNCC